MRGLSYLIFAYLALGLQTGIEPFLRWHGASPNFVLLAVVFIALNAPREPALLGCLGLGLLQDLATQGTFGLYALSYALVAMFVTAAATTVSRDHPVTHLAATLVGGLVTAFVLILHTRIHPAAAAVTTDAGVVLPASRLPAGPLIGGAIYTALAAVPVLFLLGRARGLFQFKPMKRRRGGMSR